MQLEWTEAELLETHAVEEPLFAGGVKCHGGFKADGEYVSPRTKNRWTAIENWKAEHTATFGTGVPGVYAVGDVNTYPGKKKLILSGFHEAALAAFAAKEYLSPGQKVPLQYTTTSPAMHRRLGVSPDLSDLA